MKPIWQKTFREYLLVLEIAALLLISALLFASVWLVLEESNATYLALRLADADKVHLFLESQLTEARKKIEVFTSLLDQERFAMLQHFFVDFSDIYLLDAELCVAQIYQAAPDSKVFKGFSFAGGRLGAYLRSSNREHLFSDIMRGNEDDAPSIYYAYQYVDRLYVVRMNLAYVRQFLVQFARFSGTPLMFVSKDGFVMASSNPELNIYALDLQKWAGAPSARDTLLAGGRAWIPMISDAGKIGAKVAILISTVLPESLKKSLLIFYVSFMGIFIILIILKYRMYNQFILQPLYRFSEKMKYVENGSFASSPPETDFRVAELITIDTRFHSMAEAIVQREHHLKQSEERANELAEQAAAANHAKSLFLANMSHELRTPLNAILGFAQLIGHSSHLPPTEQEYLRIIQRSGEHLLTLINHVLDLSKIEAGRMMLTLAQVDLHTLLADVSDLFALKAQQKGLRLTLTCAADVPRFIQADEVKLRQILINLLGNAIKFTPTGGVALRVSQTAAVSTNAAVWLRFEVADTGPGIALAEQAHLFNAFAQTSAGQQAQEGTGLGLAISQKFAQLMAGDIRVQSMPGDGATFILSIPVESAPTAVAPAPNDVRRPLALASDQPRLRLLIVDDHADNRQLLVNLLQPLGFETREAVNGLEALAQWRAWQPHLIWMDLRMPVLDGYQATQQIKTASQGAQTKVIALSASMIEEARRAVSAAGADDFLAKPFREAEIFDLLQKHLGVRFVFATAAPLPPAAAAAERLSADAVAAAMHALPATFRAQFGQATQDIDLARMLALLAELRAEQPLAASHLERLAQDFEYEQILACLTR